ncbi:MAG: hypothetical protein MUE46_19320 [Xanthomonadales bacterium]|jgi:protocatechuate 3,4-dioxygenase beta subunit|nr:hypothetical protein [Xanthomonadales bacterium]
MPAPLRIALFLSLCSVPTLLSATDRRLIEPLVGLPCEGCEAAFEGRPVEVPSVLVLRSATTVGEPLRVEGRVLDAAGQPRPGMLIYLHQTDGTGVYPAPVAADGLSRHARRHGQLRGWVQSDAEGRYRLITVRPGSYPQTDLPQHIHMQLIEPGCATYLIDDLLFRDDPKLTVSQERQLARGTGGNGVVLPQRTDTGWRVTRDIVLGAGVPGYPDCGAGR